MEHTEALAPAGLADRFARFVGGIDQRTKLLVLVAAAVGAALYLGWSWLAAAGLTTFIVSLLPCAVMCGLGLCANRFTGNGQSRCGGGMPSTGAEPAAGQQIKP